MLTLRLDEKQGDPQVRQRLYDELAAIVGTLSTKTLNGYPGFDARKLNDQTVMEALAAYIRRLLSEAEGAK